MPESKSYDVRSRQGETFSFVGYEHHDNGGEWAEWTVTELPDDVTDEIMRIRKVEIVAVRIRTPKS